MDGLIDWLMDGLIDGLDDNLTLIVLTHEVQARAPQGGPSLERQLKFNILKYVVGPSASTSYIL